MGKQNLFGLSGRFHGVCLAGIAEQGVFFFFFVNLQEYFLLFQREVEKRRGKPNAQAVWVVCVLSGELSVIHRGINRKGNVWAATLSFSLLVLPIFSLSEIPVSISIDVFLLFHPHKFFLSSFFLHYFSFSSLYLSLFFPIPSSCLSEACERYVCVLLCAFETSRMSVLRTTAGG